MVAADDDVVDCLERRCSFLLDAGAGSGKTSSLVNALNYIRRTRKEAFLENSQRVLCITFTNIAKDEVIERTENDALFFVSTIHDFLWTEIRGFQTELKAAINVLNEKLPNSSRRKKDSAELAEVLKSQRPITYSDRGSNFLEGRIYHDDLLAIAEIVFTNYPLLRRIVAAKYPWIFVDEYQDTDPKVVRVLLEYLADLDSPPLIGLFGDWMQSIYPKVIGHMPEEYSEKLEVIKKEENYRCSRAVIEVLNNIRTDLVQIPAGSNCQGQAVYVNVSGVEDVGNAIQQVRELCSDSLGWDINGDSEPKLLFLTHRLIARRAGYENLWSCYQKRGGFYKDEFQSGDAPVMECLAKRVLDLMDAWAKGRAGEAIDLLNAQTLELASKEQKERIAEALARLEELRAEDATIKAVATYVKEQNLIELPDALDWACDNVCPVGEDEVVSEDRDEAFFQRLLAVKFGEVEAYRNVLDDNLPYSTKHGVKGAEFDTVFVVLDDFGANWNQYSFQKYLLGTDANDDRVTRTRNLFYVCCSRSKNKLAVLDFGGAPSDITAIERIFGSDHCHRM